MFLVMIPESHTECKLASARSARDAFLGSLAVPTFKQEHCWDVSVTRVALPLSPSSFVSRLTLMPASVAPGEVQRLVHVAHEMHEEAEGDVTAISLRARSRARLVRALRARAGVVRPSMAMRITQCPMPKLGRD